MLLLALSSFGTQTGEIPNEAIMSKVQPVEFIKFLVQAKKDGLSVSKMSEKFSSTYGGKPDSIKQRYMNQRKDFSTVLAKNKSALELPEIISNPVRMAAIAKEVELYTNALEQITLPDGRNQRKKTSDISGILSFLEELNQTGEEEKEEVETETSQPSNMTVSHPIPSQTVIQLDHQKITIEDSERVLAGV